MAEIVCNNAMLSCSFGVAPSTLTVLPIARVMVSNQPAATIYDNAPMMNIKPFGMCTTLSNPQVAAATAAAQGVLTPQPCMPVTAAPWTPGSPTLTIGGNPALTSSCTLTCQWGGVIMVNNPGQFTTSAA